MQFEISLISMWLISNLFRYISNLKLGKFVPKLFYRYDLTIEKHDQISKLLETKKVKSIIGVQLQSVNFFEMLSLYEIVELFANLYSSKVNPDEILDRVGLLNKKDSYFEPLSGGQKQRLSIAVALVNDPKVLFFDEPTTGLDPQARRNMWELIKSFQKDGKTIVLTTHYMEEAEILCDRVAIIDEGKIIKINSPSNLIDELTKSGFKSTKKVRDATLEDVFIDLTGKNLRED